MSEHLGWPLLKCRNVVRSRLPVKLSSFRPKYLALVSVVASILTPMQSVLAQQLAPVWVLSTIAGTGTNADAGDGGPASIAEMGAPHKVVMDRAGNLYIAEATSVIRKISSNGVISTVAGISGQAGYSGDGGPAISAKLNNPYNVAVDNSGNLLIADQGNEVIRRVDALTGIITTIAGTPGSHGYSGDGGPAAKALLYTPFGVASDSAGNIYIADYGNQVIRKIDSSGDISTFAGNGTKGYSGDGGPATAAELTGPYNVWADAAGDVYVTTATGYTVRMIDTGGIIHTIAGTGTAGVPGNGVLATSTTLDSPRDYINDGLGNGYEVDESSHTIRWIDRNGILNLIAGTTSKSGFLGDGGPATAGKLYYPYGIAIDSSNNLYIADASNYRIRRLSLNTGMPSTAVGSSQTQNLFVQSSAVVTASAAVVTPSTPAEFALGLLSGCALGSPLAANTPCTVPVTFQPTAPGVQTAQLAITDASGNVSTIGLSGMGVAPQVNFSRAAISTIAGDGTAANSVTEVNAPRGGVIDSAGNIYFADSGNNTIRFVSAATGAISTIVGTGVAGYSGDGGAATAAELNAPAKVVVDAAGNLYIADAGNNVIRFVSAATGIISTIAGIGTPGYSGDGGPATAAELNQPQGIAIDFGGHVYVADTGNNVIRYFGQNGLISTFAGTGTAGYTGDGGNKTGAELNAPEAVALDQSGDVYIADTGNDVVRVISAANQISTFAGNPGNATNDGDGGAATAATLDQPSDVALDAAGDLYIASGGQLRIVNSSGIINTIAGTGAAGNYSGEGGAATSAVLPAPVSNLMLDSAGDVVLADTAANRLLKVATATPAPIDFGIQAPGTTGTATTFFMLNTGNSALNISAISATAGFSMQASGPSDCAITAALAPGESCSISIAFNPANNTNGAVSGSLTITDNALNGAGVTQSFALSGATKIIYKTTTSVSITPVSPVYGQPATITATIANGNAATGTVSFTVNGNSIGSVPLSNSQATIALPILPAGNAQISANYSGDANNSSSTAAAGVNIQPAVLTVTANNATMAQGTSVPSLTYTIAGFVNGDTVSVATGAPAETTAATSSSQQGATYPILIMQGSLAAPNYIFTFVNGTLTIGPPPTPDFLLSVTPTTVNLPSSQPYVATVTLIPLYNYKGTTEISCTSVPQGLGCPAVTLTGDGGPLTGNGQGNPVWAQVSVSAVGKSLSASAASKLRFEAQRLCLAFGMPMWLLGFAWSGGRKGRRFARIFSLVFLAVLAAGVTACGSGTSVIAKGTYQVTITAADASSHLSHSTSMTLTLQ